MERAEIEIFFARFHKQKAGDRAKVERRVERRNPEPCAAEEVQRLAGQVIEKRFVRPPQSLVRRATSARKDALCPVFDQSEERRRDGGYALDLFVGDRA